MLTTLRFHLEVSRLQNCFVNATFLTIMWTHLMCGDYNMGRWGEATAIFLDIVMDGAAAPLCLRSHSKLQPGFAQWQQLKVENSTTQQDYSEFLHYFFGWSAADMLHWPWAGDSVVQMKWSLLKRMMRMPLYCCILTYGKAWIIQNNFNMCWINGTTQMECYRHLSRHRTLCASRFVDFKMPPILIAQQLILEPSVHIYPASRIPGWVWHAFHIRLLHWCTTVEMLEVGITIVSLHSLTSMVICNGSFLMTIANQWRGPFCLSGSCLMSRMSGWFDVTNITNGSSHQQQCLLRNLHWPMSWLIYVSPAIFYALRMIGADDVYSSLLVVTNATFMALTLR